jgi:hypothetical protein
MGQSRLCRDGAIGGVIDGCCRIEEHLRRPFMSKGFGLGRIQRGCLRVIEECEAAGKRPTMLNIASEVYRVRPDRLSDAQHVATKRALASLRQKGLVSGQEDFQFALEWPQRLADSGLREG